MRMVRNLRSIALVVAASCCGSSLFLLASPLAVSTSSGGDQHSGAAVFDNSGCVRCHGANGSGGEKGPDLRRVGSKLNPSQIEEQIRHGGRGMPPFGGVLETSDIDRLVTYLAAQRHEGSHHRTSRTGKH